MDLMKTLMLYMALLLSGVSGTDAELPKEPVPAVETAAPAEAWTEETTAPAAVPTVSPAETVNYETLRSGSRGQSVTQLQQRLEDLGYYKSKVDGSYGRNTKAAVEAFQRDHGLTADGIAGPKTLAALDALMLPEAQKPLTEAGHTVQADGNTLTLDWYRDEDGCPWVGLAAFAETNGWEVCDGVYRAQPSDVPVAASVSENGCVLTVDGAETAGCAQAWDGEVYVNAAFFEKLGAAVAAEGETLLLYFNR